MAQRGLACAVVLVVEDEDGDDCVHSWGFGSKLMMRGALSTLMDDIRGVRWGLVGQKIGDDDEPTDESAKRGPV